MLGNVLNIVDCRCASDPIDRCAFSLRIKIKIFKSLNYVEHFYLKFKYARGTYLNKVSKLFNTGAPTTVLLGGSGNTMTKISEAEQHYEPTTR